MLTMMMCRRLLLNGEFKSGPNASSISLFLSIEQPTHIDDCLQYICNAYKEREMMLAIALSSTCVA